jgi:hypothetical protein
MTWTSDRTAKLIYAGLGVLLMLSWVIIPA